MMMIVSPIMNVPRVNVLSETVSIQETRNAKEAMNVTWDKNVCPESTFVEEIKIARGIKNVSRKGVEPYVPPKLIVTPMNCAKEALAIKTFVIETVIVKAISDVLIKSAI